MALQHRAFLFTDIVGSTAHWEADSPVMLDALGVHDIAVRAAIELADGVIFAHTGDGVAASFDTATAATVAARGIVASLAEVDWPHGRRIEVRVGLHVGEAHGIGGNWFGPTVNRAARVCDAALPGQILATSAVADTADVSSGLETISHGCFALEGIGDDVGLVELAGPTGSVGRPRVRSRVRTNSPSSDEPIIGRHDELDAIESALAPRSRVVTITGIGGMGKTTLARTYVDRHLSSTDDDVWWVDLSAVADGADVKALIERSVREVSGSDASFRTSGGLLALDNCEHVTTAAGEVISERDPRVRVLVTSRRPLGCIGEHVIKLGPLGTGREGPAVELFVEVLQRADHRRTLTRDERSTVGRLCDLVSGVPLAVKMVAARCHSLPVEDAEQLLAGSLRGLTDRSAPPRQASIDHVIRWSFERLGQLEGKVLITVSLLAGFDFATALRMWSPELEPLELVDALDVLVRENLLQFDGRRYEMLEPIRVFAAGEFETWPDREVWQTRLVRAVLDLFRGFEREWCHLHPLAIAGAASPNLDAGNARVALDSCLARDDLQAASQLLSSAGVSLFEAGEFNLLRSFARQLLDRTQEFAGDRDRRAALLWTAGQSSWRVGEPSIAVDALVESAQLYRESNDAFGTALATTFLGATHWDLGNREAATATMAEALEHWSHVDDALFGHTGAPLFYWYLDTDPVLCRQLVDRAAEASGADGLDPHVREVRALLTMDEDLEAALEDLLAATDQWRKANNSGCLAHALEAAALWAVRSDRFDLARTLRDAIGEHRRLSGIPPLALETITAAQVERALTAAPASPFDDQPVTIGLSSAYEHFVTQARSSDDE